MSLTAVVALLQAALMLLQLAQATPGLPQSFRDQATQVAQRAIVEAVSALGSQSNTQASNTQAPSPTPNQMATGGQMSAVTVTPPSLLEFYVTPDFAAGNSYVYGGNCQQVKLEVAIRDGSGNLLKDQQITFINPETGEVTTLSTHGNPVWYSTASIPWNYFHDVIAVFEYTPRATSTTESIKFTSGSLVGSVQVNIRKSLYETFVTDDPGNIKQASDGGWYVETSGKYVDPVSGKCL